MVEKARIQLAVGRRKKLEQDLEHVTQEMYRRNLDLVRANKTLSLLRTIDTLVLESPDSLAALCKQICDAITESYEYPFVAILSKELRGSHLPLTGWSANGKTKLVDTASIEHVYLNTAAYPWYTDPKGGKIFVISNLSSPRLSRQLHSNQHIVDFMVKTLGLKSVCMIKLMARQDLVGVMAIGLNHHIERLPADEQEFLERLGGAVGVAVDNKRLFEENQHIVGQLQKSNHRLRLLDEAKDDFISMASHQLRTPLTSVKGYISMVVEGDVGKLNDRQDKLLNQAFVSAQRMVYLIADLLNVSRLKTGKFVIQSIPSNLADVIEGEVNQLLETATARGLELIYRKPANFPMLMLDETKIRQVVMNFIDNAIYYTPRGGYIKVVLEDKGDSIQFEVIDNGIGVPKHEQHNLFTKFFRADNAKKARPDGTGLGLFMAKKVIIAQGGSVIFHSEEGHGSTFGFAFEKAKLPPLTTLPNTEDTSPPK
jgi:signal transduction histidine kinase